MVDLRAFRYHVSTLPYPVGHDDVSYRDGLLLRSQSELGQVNWSEAAPLPGWSKENLDDLIVAIRDGDFDRYPSLQFAHSMLANDYAWPDKAVVPVNALLVGGRNEIVAEAKSLADRPFLAAKLKVGRQAIDDDIALVNSVRKNLRPDQSLRLDANRAWSLSEAIQFGLACRDLKIEYIEEPTHSPEDCEAFFHATRIRYALDETVIENSVISCPNVAALIVKPTLIGGVCKISKLLMAEVPLVFSACFETQVGLAQIARLANRFAPDIPAGLDTHRWLREDVTNGSCQFADGTMTAVYPFGVDEETLQEIPI